RVYMHVLWSVVSSCLCPVIPPVFLCVNRPPVSPLFPYTTLFRSGEAAPGTALEQEAHTLLVEAPALAIPDAIQISVEGVEAVTHLTAESVELPADTTLISDPDTLVVSVVLPVVAAEPEAEEEPAAAAAPAEAAEQAAE